MLPFPTVFLVDPDARFVDFCRKLLEPRSISVVAFKSPHDFLTSAARPSVGCIVTELQFDGESGIDFCHRLKELGWSLPVLIHTAFGDVSRCSRAFRAGVSDFLEKTIPPDQLLRRVLEIISECRAEQESWRNKQSVTERLSRLTEREKEVVRALISGLSMKEIASDFGTSFQSVARHRQRILAKLQVDNDVALANLLRDYRWSDSLNDSIYDSHLAAVHH